MVGLRERSSHVRTLASLRVAVHLLLTEHYPYKVGHAEDPKPSMGICASVLSVTCCTVILLVRFKTCYSFAPVTSSMTASALRLRG